MATKAKEINTKSTKKRTWNEYIFGKKKKKGLGNTETATNTFKDTAINLGAGIGGGIVGSSLGGLKGMIAGIAGIVAGVMYDIDALTSAGAGAVVGTLVTPPEKVGDKTKDFATTAKDNGSYFWDKFKSVTMLDQMGKKKEEEIKVIVKPEASTTAQPALPAVPPKTDTANMVTTDNKTVQGLALQSDLSGLSLQSDLSGLLLQSDLSGLALQSNLSGF